MKVCLYKLLMLNVLYFNPEYGEWLVDDGTGTTMVDDLIYEFVPEIGESYNITGIVDYSYGSFRIEPRYSSDISISSTSQEDVLNINFNLYNFPIHSILLQ